MKTFDAFKDAVKFLEQTTSQTYLQCKIEAEEIFSYVMDYEKAKLYSDYIPEITERLRAQIKAILKKRKDGVPLSYILKKHKFYKHEFYVDENVLIPRSETESIIEYLLHQGDEIYKKKGRCIFLDAGCGSGCVGITVANERPEWKIILSDFYRTAINVAKKNLGLCNFNNIELICGNWLEPFGGHTLDFVFSNPPASGTAFGFVLKLTAGGSHTITWPSSVDWAGGSAPDAPASGETDVLVFFSYDGGTTWYGNLAIDAAA